MVAVHGIVAAANRGDRHRRRQRRAQALDVLARRSWRRVAAIGEGMYDGRHTCLCEDLRERRRVILMRMHAPRRDQAHQVAGAAGLPQARDQADQGRGLLDLAVGDGLADARQVLHHHTAGADVEMSDLGVAHLPLRQADILARREEEGVGAGVPQTVERRGARQVHGVVGRVLPPAPAVQDHQHHRTTFLHHLHLLASASGTPIRDSPSIHLMVPLPAAAVSATQ